MKEHGREAPLLRHIAEATVKDVLKGLNRAATLSGVILCCLLSLEFTRS